MAPGRWGWDGGTGTTAHVDPTRGTVGVLLTAADDDRGHWTVSATSGQRWRQPPAGDAPLPG